MKGQGTVQGLNGTVYCMAEGPDGKIYVGGILQTRWSPQIIWRRWNPVTEHGKR